MVIYPEVIYMLLDDFKKWKQEMGFSIEELAKLTQVPVGTLQKLLSGQTKSPRRETVEKLRNVMKGLPAEAAAYKVAETAVFYDNSVPRGKDSYGTKKQGEYTIEDYYGLPEDKRYELIDGVIYEMASPTVLHQMIAGSLYYQLMKCEEEHAIETCFPYIAPLDVQLDKDNKTMVQPDVMVSCEPDQELEKRIFGAPAFVAEVLSPSSHKKDMFLKLWKYKNAGVKEYWLIHPEKQQVIVYLFHKDDNIAIYSFEDKIPVSISDGLCEVCFGEIKQRIAKREE